MLQRPQLSFDPESQQFAPNEASCNAPPQVKSASPWKIPQMNAACPAGIAIGIGLGIEGIYYMGAECLVCVCNIDMKLMDVLWPTNFANDKSVFHEPVNCDLIVSVGHANNLSFCLLSALPHSQPEMNVKSERFLGKLWLKFFAKKTEPKINAQVHHRRPKKSIYEINQSLKFMKIYASIAFCSLVKTCIVQHWSPPIFLVHPQGLHPLFWLTFCCNTHIKCQPNLCNIWLLLFMFFFFFCGGCDRARKFI